jgi:hypothetical protein
MQEVTDGELDQGQLWAVEENRIFDVLDTSRISMSGVNLLMRLAKVDMEHPRSPGQRMLVGVLVELAHCSLQDVIE